MTKASESPHTCTLQADHQPSGSEGKTAVTQQQVITALTAAGLAARRKDEEVKESHKETCTSLI